ncbi:MAG: hypothetical protein FWB98_05600 [Defluviitaleaceae bacterium]|nr:hypothetical protein [Defluviitaleaceae bacterium]
MLRVFTIEHEELLRKEFMDFDGSVASAVWALERAADKLGKSANFADFLLENNYIYFDGFLRICADD